MILAALPLNKEIFGINSDTANTPYGVIGGGECNFISPGVTPNPVTDILDIDGNTSLSSGEGRDEATPPVKKEENKKKLETA